MPLLPGARTFLRQSLFLTFTTQIISCSETRGGQTFTLHQLKEKTFVIYIRSQSFEESLFKATTHFPMSSTVCLNLLVENSPLPKAPPSYFLYCSSLISWLESILSTSTKMSDSVSYQYA